MLITKALSLDVMFLALRSSIANPQGARCPFPLDALTLKPSAVKKESSDNVISGPSTESSIGSEKSSEATGEVNKLKLKIEDAIMDIVNSSLSLNIL
ncbi:hypothetical protein [Lysinibacillus sp. NPDC056232]|uniref:hypothetical protein n=1 Tax=Lysinibacillus sp. NPDC056232 TaxID=3345756 RepID=UPI0035E22998